MTQDIKKITLNKIDVAKRLFKEAVILYFEKRDPIAIHHLVHAAHELLNKLTGKSIFLDKTVIKEEYYKQVLNAHKKSRNYIKHADNDRDELLNFNPNINYLLLLDCAFMLNDLIKTDFIPSKMFLIWCRLEHPALFVNDILPNLNKDIIQFDHNDYEFIAKYLKSK